MNLNVFNCSTLAFQCFRPKTKGRPAEDPDDGDVESIEEVVNNNYTLHIHAILTDRYQLIKKNFKYIFLTNKYH